MSAPKSEAPTPEKAPVKVSSKRAEAGKRNVSGVWMVYHVAITVEQFVLVTSPHADELEARRAAMDGAADSRVVFVPWGQSVAEALAK